MVDVVLELSVTVVGKSKMVNCSDLVGVPTMTVPPCQEVLLPNLIKFFFFFSCGGGGATNPPFSMVLIFVRQSSDSNNCVIDFNVVGVNKGV